MSPDVIAFCPVTGTLINRRLRSAIRKSLFPLIGCPAQRNNTGRRSRWSVPDSVVWSAYSRMIACRRPQEHRGQSVQHLPIWQNDLGSPGLPPASHTVAHIDDWKQRFAPLAVFKTRNKFTFAIAMGFDLRPLTTPMGLIIYFGPGMGA